MLNKKKVSVLLVLLMFNSLTVAQVNHFQKLKSTPSELIGSQITLHGYLTPGGGPVLIYNELSHFCESSLENSISVFLKKEVNPVELLTNYGNKKVIIEVTVETRKAGRNYDKVVPVIYLDSLKNILIDSKTNCQG